MTPRLSILGLLNYDAHLFDEITFPDVVDKQVLIDTIIDEGAELIIRYPDPVVAKRMISSWAVRRSYSWDKIAALMSLTYNPIHNYDRTETESIENSKTSERDSTNNVSQTLVRDAEQTQRGTIGDVGSRDTSGTDTGTVTYGKGSAETKSVTGFNSNTLVASEKVEGSGQDTETRNLANGTEEDSTNTRTLNLTNGEDATDTLTRQDTIDDNLSEDTNTLRQLRNYGNIGVTTTQQMMLQEMEIAQMLDLTKIIADEFIETFCVGVY